MISVCSSMSADYQVEYLSRQLLRNHCQRHDISECFRQKDRLYHTTLCYTIITCAGWGGDELRRKHWNASDSSTDPFLNWTIWHQARGLGGWDIKALGYSGTRYCHHCQVRPVLDCFIWGFIFCLNIQRAAKHDHWPQHCDRGARGQWQPLCK